MRKFLEAESPLSQRISISGDSGPDFRSFWRAGATLGITSLLIPEEFGGVRMERAVACLAVVAEEMGRVVAPGPLVACNVVADTLARCGSEAQRQEWLPPIATGECIATWAVAEVADRWLPRQPSVRVSARSDGWTLEGVKKPVEAGAEADLFLVTAETEQGEPVQLLVPATSDGVVVEPLTSLDLARPFARITFDQVRLPASAVLGGTRAAEAGPVLDVDRQIDLALCLQGAESSAIMESAFQMTVDYLKDRRAFGRTVASYQAIKHRLADHKVWLEASLGISTAVVEALCDEDRSASRLASAAKVHIGEQSVTTLSDCSQLLGGISMTWEHPHHAFFRRVTVNRSLYGSPGHHRERLCQLVGL
jgi:alkylation response protein AidB-like acyl-CoA dehydrogenase